MANLTITPTAEISAANAEWAPLSFQIASWDITPVRVEALHIRDEDGFVRNIPVGTNLTQGNSVTTVPELYRMPAVGNRIASIVPGLTFAEVEKGKWAARGTRWAQHPLGLRTWTYPRLRAFVSKSFRSATPESTALDHQTADIVESYLRAWGVDPFTVNIPYRVDDDELRRIIRQEVERSDCVIGIATRRDEVSGTGVWKTFDWIHAESAFKELPTLILHDHDIALGGILKTFPTLPFNAANASEFSERFDQWLPWFRDSVQAHQRINAEETFAKVALGGSLLLLAGTVIYLAGREDGKRDDAPAHR